MADINLSKAVRSNLSSLQTTASMMSKTSDRLSTGNKVNSALDNPTNFFTASSLNSRAGDLNNLMDSMANGIKTIEAADNGLSAIAKNLESMQSTLRQARQDKSFQTKSYDLSALMSSTTLAGTEQLTLSGGALGATTNVSLTKTGTIPAAATSGQVSVAAASFTSIDFNAAAAVPAAGTQAAGAFAAVTLDADDTISFDIAVDGGSTTSISISKTDVDTALGGSAGAIATAADMATVLNAKLSAASIGATAAANGGVVEFTSATTGINSAVAVTNAVADDGVNAAGNATLTGGLDAMATAVQGNAGTPGAAKTMSFTIAADGGTAQTLNFAVADAGSDGIMDITEFKDAINSKSTGVTASINTTTGALEIKSDTTGSTSSVATSAVTVSGGTATTSGITAVAANATGATGANASTTTGPVAKSVDDLVGELNNKKLPDNVTDNPLYGKIRASNDNGKLRIENLSTQELNIDGVTSGGVVNGTSTGAASILGNTVRADLASQFNELRDQLDKLSDDASFNGINLLRGDNLKITFNETGTSSIDIQTKGEKSINAANLDLSTTLTAKDLNSDSGIDAFLDQTKSALNAVRAQSSAFGSNLSIVQNRQDFTKSMINTLETGAGNLTLADMNQEAANMMALQTRQSLAQSTLSMANQADQGVLQLLR